jgi:phospholipid transport system substrate-binding protein
VDYWEFWTMNKLCKSRRFLCLLSVVGMALLSGSGAAFAADDSATATPLELVSQAATQLQEQLTGKQEYFAENSAELYELINSVLLPNFDVEHAGKLVLGKEHWLAASDTQRQRFIDAFYGFLVKSYANGILEFDQERMTIGEQPKYSKDRRKAQVGTQLTMANGDTVNVNYVLRDAQGNWKIYDVRIDGVSYVQNYHNQFDAEISARGLDAVIERLESEA